MFCRYFDFKNIFLSDWFITTFFLTSQHVDLKKKISQRIDILPNMCDVSLIH